MKTKPFNVKSSFKMDADFSEEKIKKHLGALIQEARTLHEDGCGITLSIAFQVRPSPANELKVKKSNNAFRLQLPLTERGRESSFLRYLAQ